MGEDFFMVIEDEPRDLLGPTHQRLVMYCLAEILLERLFRISLEKNLKAWLLFECRSMKKPQLASEVEFPERALAEALRDTSPPNKVKLFESLVERATFPLSITKMLILWLKDG
jgi:hypothetical protein